MEWVEVEEELGKYYNLVAILQNKSQFLKNKSLPLLLLSPPLQKRRSSGNSFPVSPRSPSSESLSLLGGLGGTTTTLRQPHRANSLQGGNDGKGSGAV